ncbi:hypothetical protein BEWA_001780 [Theileria equi strain WA]|uniref:ubiquitinyl hydrolase 1 n=1 Tax=Theileria equi strain WA TaxID=1537102 RepID=L0B0I1_THEEQ|nr:hypothetical protein BEWA_001780 [Theileria equi strain WA]AFZ80771.1 hypothetical protein BEWA_001780 [Theileria equi strain WA]|eukprot:XP_004830437.1 hypothetical protein BEWA_001780 [Theileria equi strain WA]
MLDSEETRLLNSKGDSNQILGYGNSADSGHFNVTVLQNALMIREISCTYLSLRQLTLKMFESDNIGFICNIQAHWFPIRKLASGQWYILDSLRRGPIPVESGWLYSHLSDILENKDGVVFIVTPTNYNLRLPEPEPNRFKNLQSHQFYLSASQIANDSLDEDAPKSFLYKNGESKSVSHDWPTTGGVRLDEHVSIEPKKEETFGNDAIKVAIKVNSSDRIIQGFGENSVMEDIFKWIESKHPLGDYDFYFLVQTAPSRKFIRYSNGSVELIANDQNPVEVTRKSLVDLDFGPQELLILQTTLM